MTCLPGPAYLSLGAREVAARAEMALGLLGPDRCTVCPRLCKVNRLADQRGLCAIGRQAIVASHFPHFGEENCLRGQNGSGTIFFSGCNLRCVFCQNFDISWQLHGQPVTPKRLAAMMLQLQDRGCHNINFVTPEHVVPQILQALPAAIDGGLRLPIVYNTSCYDSLDSLALMDGIVGYHEIDRQLTRDEYELAAQFAGELGLTRLDRRSRASGLQLPAGPAPQRKHLAGNLEIQWPAGTGTSSTVTGGRAGA